MNTASTNLASIVAQLPSALQPPYQPSLPGRLLYSQNLNSIEGVIGISVH